MATDRFVLRLLQEMLELVKNYHKVRFGILHDFHGASGRHLE